MNNEWRWNQQDEGNTKTETSQWARYDVHICSTTGIKTKGDKHENSN